MTLYLKRWYKPLVQQIITHNTISYMYTSNTNCNLYNSMNLKLVNKRTRLKHLSIMAVLNLYGKILATWLT